MPNSRPLHLLVMIIHHMRNSYSVQDMIMYLILQDLQQILKFRINKLSIWALKCCFVRFLHRVNFLYSSHICLHPRFSCFIHFFSPIFVIAFTESSIFISSLMSRVTIWLDFRFICVTTLLDFLIVGISMKILLSYWLNVTWLMTLLDCFCAF